LKPYLPIEVEPPNAAVLLLPLADSAVLLAEPEVDDSVDTPPFCVLAEPYVPIVPDAVDVSACEPPPMACAVDERPLVFALDSAFEFEPVEEAPAPTPPPFGADLPSPAPAVLVLPPHELDPALLVPSPTLTPACAGLPPELLPRASPAPIEPLVEPPPVLLRPAELLLSVP
jgi:hypothetical protein